MKFSQYGTKHIIQLIKKMEKKINKNEHEKEMLFSISIWLAKFLNDYGADTFIHKVTNVTDKKGKNIGSYQLKVTKL